MKTMYRFEDYTLIIKETEKEFYIEVPEQRFLSYLKEIPEASLHEYGTTYQETIDNLKNQFNFFQEDLLKRGVQLPPPPSKEEKNYSGKIILRMPVWLHARLAVQSEEEEVSLNSLLVNYLIRYSTTKDTIREICAQWMPQYIQKSYDYAITQNASNYVNEPVTNYHSYLKHTSGYKHVG